MSEGGNSGAAASSAGRMTADRLRHEIDTGSTADKIPFSDPAASPLGTDDEAAGTAPSHERVALAASSELKRDPGPGPNVAESQTRAIADVPSRWNRPMLLVCAVVLIAAGVLFAFVLQAPPGR